MDLVPHMYWERQEPGSQLCAQHCLNNLLQQFTYSEFDLADIAKRLDEAERAQLHEPQSKSHNFDDTGYFSISVLERALEVWDLTLVRWRGEAMREYQEHPEEQVAFILHLSSHWIPLRRFGSNDSYKRWYNLNSFLPHPEWISPTYLRMVLSQAEQEGYSVFCVRKAAPSDDGWGDGGLASLPECQADVFAVQLGEPQGRSGGTVAPIGRGAQMSDQPSVDPSTITPPDEHVDPFDRAGPSQRRRRQPDPVDPFGDAEEDTAPAQRRPAQVWEDEELDEVHDFTQHQRDYDDEDAALQAALRASMEDIPSDWVAPTLQPKTAPKKAEMIHKEPVSAPPQAEEEPEPEGEDETNELEPEELSPGEHRNRLS
ncbi:Josephin-domain-containing protein [Kockovaella imperatae]|uniref:Ataxin-3 homolog n=1 Tax=Kockovaella imperatae TaxID=4999 RepID=A0A1Y1URF1_9TREE|nr:Josephin-domain-containing protein [Kockovaella imperatae]ORX40651.1 Josephin-domain-containing protein [Kockovaella imperatae]